MRRDKKKDLILDFTSLLDVVMLLLFFFILFSRFDVSRAETEADNAKTEAAAQVALAESQAQEKIDEAEKSKSKYDDLIEENTKLQEQLEHNIEIVNQVTSQEANEIIAFNSGNNLKLILTATEDSNIPMTLKAVLNQRIVGECYVTEKYDGEEYKANDFTAERLAQWMTSNGIKNDSVVMCDFIYDSNSDGSSEAYKNITRVLDSVHSVYGYEHFYYSSTNTSIRNKKRNTGQEENKGNERENE